MIHRLTAPFCALMLLLWFAPQVIAQSDWRVTVATDSMTDKVKRTAVVTNEDGHSLSVYRGPGEAAWVLFSLGKSSFDTLAPRHAPIYRVDKNEPHDLERARTITARGIGLSLYVWEPRWVNFFIWHGKEAEGRAGALRELMSGQTVVFRYTLGSGGYKETTFPLLGAAQAIADALGITAATNPDLEAAATAYRSAIVGATARCQQDMPRIRICLDRVAACNKLAGHDLQALQQCLH